MNTFYGTHWGGTHVNEGGKNWAVLNSFLQAQCVCSLLHCFRGRLQQDSDTSYALSHPDLSLAPFCLSFSLLRASERLSTVSFNSLPRSRTLIILITPSGPPRKHSTRRSLARRTHVKVICVALLTRAVVTNMHNLYRQLSIASLSHQSWSHNVLYIYSLYIQFYTLLHLSSDWSNKVMSWTDKITES